MIAAAPQIEGLWKILHAEAAKLSADEPVLAEFLRDNVLRHSSFDDALAYHLSHKLGGRALAATTIREIIADALAADPAIARAAMADIEAVHDRDPACKMYATPFLFFKGYQALQCYRVAHWLWQQEREALASLLQNRISEIFAVDIHPAARIGKGILLDHGTGFVVGETAVIDDHVSILQEVTLGGTGKETGDRHPKIREGVMIGSGARVLGNIDVGARAKIGAGSVVLRDVPAGCTAAGVPAKIVGKCANQEPAREMDQDFGDRDG